MVMPLALLEKCIGKQVSVLLKDGRTIDGDLAGYDEYLNMVLHRAEEKQGENVKIIGDVILRGNNVISISPIISREG